MKQEETNKSIITRKRKARLRLKKFLKVCKYTLEFYEQQGIEIFVDDFKNDILELGTPISYYNMHFCPKKLGYKIVRKGWGSKPKLEKL